jgi:crotonobetainyl-CoA:carnitine CoA-transferase CaiB-like acyl-CoA transferase
MLVPAIWSEGCEVGENVQERALDGYRVLDLTDEQGWMCGKVLADLGAEVIKIEPPGGDPGRRRGPFYQDDVDPHKSLCWFAYNTSKRSLCLDLTRPQGRDLLYGLVREADFVIESFPPGYLDALGVGYADLKAVNPWIIFTSITPFGQSGPYRDLKATDIVCMAMSGFMALTGEAGGRPVRITLPQAALHAGVEAAIASLLAHFWRVRSGRGQHIDVSIQACLVWTLMGAPGFVTCLDTMPTRQGPCYDWVGYPRRLNFPCADGHVALFLVGSYMGYRSMQALTHLMQAEGLAPPFMLEKDWKRWNIAAGEKVRAESERIDEAVMAYVCNKTKRELYETAMAHRIHLAPVSTTAEICDNEQLRARQFFVPVAHPELGTVFEYPGAFGKFSRTPCRPPVRAPLVGEHSRQVLHDLLDLDEATISSLEADGVIACTHVKSPSEVAAMPRFHPRTPSGSAPSSALPLEGIRVVDFAWVAVGAVTSKYLADHGAEVIRIESWAHPDGMRYAPPFVEGIGGENRSYLFALCNTSKYSVSLNLSRPEARELARRLVAIADVVTESFTPKVLRQWQLDYAHLVQIKPDLVMLSTCLQGQTGPRALHPGFGNLIAGLLGFYELTGWPEGDACAIYGAYTDFLAPRFAALCLLAALEYRRRTGKGQYIDLAQSESSLHFLAPAILDYTANRRVMRRQGNRDPHMAPHGAYRCQGDDRWCVIAVASDAEWRRLCEVAGHPEWQQDPRFITLADRLRHADALDALVESWTRTQRDEEVMTRLQAAGVAAGVVKNMRDLHTDPQLQHRDFWIELDHSEVGPLKLEGHQFRFSTLPSRPRFARPELGEHNAYVLGELLGLSTAEIQRLEAEGIVY